MAYVAEKSEHKPQALQRDKTHSVAIASLRGCPVSRDSLEDTANRQEIRSEGREITAPPSTGHSAMTGGVANSFCNIAILPDGAPRCNHTVKYDGLSTLQRNAVFHFSFPGGTPPTPGRMLVKNPAGILARRVHPSMRVSPSYRTTDLSAVSTGDRSSLTRWASLGCDQTRRHSFTTTDAGAFTLQRPASCIEAAQQEPLGFHPVSTRLIGQGLPVFSCNRERSEFASSRPNYAPNDLAKQSVGGFHGVSLMQLRQTSSLEAF